MVTLLAPQYYQILMVWGMCGAVDVAPIYQTRESEDLIILY